MKHIFVSPHFDDAIGSCGGTISRLERAGEQVVVHTVCGGEPLPPYSPFAAELHAQWRCGNAPVKVRSAEDAGACCLLGCERRLSAVPDAIYRQSRAGLHPYFDEKALFGPAAGADRRLHTLVAREIQSRWPTGGTRFYFPLGVGHHVDHVIAFRAGLALLNQACDVRFYQDFFYTDWDCAHLRGRPLRSSVQPIAACDFERKVEAFSRYRSQVAMLFGSDREALCYFAAAGRQAAAASRLGEVFWQSTGTSNPPVSTAYLTFA